MNCSLDIRETAFLYAITAAGVMHAVTQCGCVTLQSSSQTHQDFQAEEVPIQASPVQNGRWEWGGCGDDVDFGNDKSRQFMDTRQRKGKSDIRTLIDLHNNEAGRLVRLHFWVWNMDSIGDRKYIFLDSLALIEKEKINTFGFP